MDLIEVSSEGMELPPQKERAVPEEQAIKLATMASLADNNINGGDALPISDWLQITSNGGEAEARDTLARQKSTKELDAMLLTEVTTQGGDPSELMQAYSDTSEENIDKSRRSILETETAAAIVNDSFTDPVRSTVIDNEDLNLFSDEETQQLTRLDMSEQRTAAVLMRQEMMVKLAKQLEESGVAGVTAQFAAMMVIPGSDTAAQYTMGGGRDAVLLGDAIRNDQDKFWNSTDPVGQLQEISARLDANEWMPDILKLDTLYMLTETDFETSFRTAIEIADVVGLGMIAKSFASLGQVSEISKLAKLAKNPKMSVNKTQTTLAKQADGVVITAAEEADLIESVIPTSSGSFRNSTSAAAARKLDVHAAKLEQISVIKGQDFLSDAEKVTAIQQVTKQIEATLPKTRVTDVSDIDEAGRLSFTLGTGEKGTEGFSSPEAATAGAGRMGLADGFYKVIEEDGVYKVTVQRDLPTNDVVTGETLLTPMTKEAIEVLWPSFYKYLGPRGLAGNKIVMKGQDRLAEGAIVGTNTTAKLSAIFNDTAAIFNKMSKGQRRDFEAVMLYTQTNNNGRWLSYKDFSKLYTTNFKRKPSVNEEVAYGGAIQLHQADEYIINLSVRQDLTRLGFQEVGVTGLVDEPAIGKIIPVLDRQSKNVNVLDTTDGKLYGVGESASKALDKMDDNDNLVLVKYLQDVNTKAGKAQYLIVNKQNVNIKSLRARVLNHFDGPHREYKSNTYIKQPKLLIEGDKATLTGRRTHFNVGSEAEGIKIADSYNRALAAFLSAEQLVKQGLGAEAVTEATNIISKNTKYSSFEEFGKALDDGKISRAPFEAWANHGSKPLNKTIDYSKDGVVQAVDVDGDMLNLSEGTRKYLDQGRMYYSSRGEHLENPQGDLAPILNHTEALENSIKHIVNTRAFGEYKSRHVRNWVETFVDELDTHKVNGVPVKRPDWYHFEHGKWLKDTPLQIKEQGQRAREALNRTVHAQSEESAGLTRFKYEMAQYVDGNKGNALSRKGALVLNKILELEPVQQVRALVFKTFLGGLDAFQVGVQMSMAPAVIAVSPRHGLQALGMLPILRASATLGNPKAMDHLAGIMSLPGIMIGKRKMKPTEVRMLIDDMKNSGVDIVSGTQAQLDNPFDGSVIYNNRLLQYGNKALDVGLIPFKEGERLNQMLGFSIAWLERFEELGNIRPKGDELGRVLNRAETLAGNMKSSSRAAYQDGVLALPVQMGTHPIRVVEMMLEQSGGLTKPERARFLGTLAVTYGLAGIGLDTAVDFIADEYFEATGEHITNEQRRMLSDGVMGQLFEDKDISRLQPGKNTLIGTVLDILFGEEVDAGEVMGGPSRHLVGVAWEAVGGSMLLRGLIAGTVGLKDVPVMSFEIIKDLAFGIPPGARYRKAWRMYQEGVLATSTGNFIDQATYSTWDVILTAGGFPPRLSKDVYEASLDMKEMKKAIGADAKQFADLMRSAALADTKASKDHFTYKADHLAKLYNNDAVKPHIKRLWTKAAHGEMIRLHKTTTKQNIGSLYNGYGRDYTTSLIGEQ